jgi:hypothetical protein
VRCYYPRNTSEDEKKDMFCEQPQGILGVLQKRDIKVVFGIFNAKIG